MNHKENHKEELIERIKSGTCDLANELIGADLSNVDLRGVNLKGANLFGVDLSQSILVEVDLSLSILNEANLYQTNLSRANLCKCKALKSKMIFADFGEANIAFADFSNSNLNFADFSFTKGMFTAYFSQADLSHAILENASLRQIGGGNLTETKLRDADLRYALSAGVNLSNAYLGGANLNARMMKDVNFEGATFMGAQFSVHTEFINVHYGDKFQITKPPLQLSLMYQSPIDIVFFAEEEFWVKINDEVRTLEQYSSLSKEEWYQFCVEAIEEELIWEETFRKTDPTVLAEFFRKTILGTAHTFKESLAGL